MYHTTKQLEGIRHCGRSENFLHFFTDVHDDEFDGQWMSTQ